MPQDPNKPVSLPEWEETVRSHYGIPKELWSAMADQESGGDWKATSPTGVRGKYQVTQRTARQYNLNRDDPFEQVAAAGRYLKEQFDAVKGPDDSSRWYGALARYYGGPSAVDDQGNFSTRSVDGVSNPAEHVARVARRIEAMRKQAQDESLAPVQPQAQTAAPADQPAPIQQAIQPLRPEKVDWTRRGPVMPQRPQPTFAGDPNAEALQKMLGKATVEAYKIPKTAEDAFKGRQRYATTPQAPQGMQPHETVRTQPQAAGGFWNALGAPVGAPGAAIVSRPSTATEDRTWTEAGIDTAMQLGSGLVNVPGLPASLVAPHSRLAKGLQQASQTVLAQQSAPQQARMQRAQQAVDQEDTVIGQFLEAVKQYTTDPALASQLVMTNLPMMLPGLAAGKLAQVAALARGASTVRAAQMATTAAGLTNAVANAGGARQDSFDDIKQAALQAGQSEEEATRTALLRSLPAAGLGAATGWLGGTTGLESRIFGKAVGNTIGQRVAGALTELGTEQLEEVVPQIGTNIAVNPIQPRSPLKGVGRTMAETLIASAPGAALTGITHTPDGGVAKVPDAVQDEAQPEAQPRPRSVRQQMTELQRPGTPPTPEQIDRAETAYRQRKPRTTPLQDRIQQMEPTAPLTEDLGTGLSQGQQAGTIEDRWGEAISNSPRPETVKTALEQAEQAQRQFERSNARPDGDTDALTALQRKDQALRQARNKVSGNTPGGLRARQRLFDEIKGNQRKIDQKKQQMRRRKGQPISQPDVPVTGPMGDANAPTASGPMTPPTSRPSAALPREYTNRIDSNTDYPGGELPRTAGIRPEGQPIELPERTAQPQGRGITPRRTPGPLQRPVGPQRPTTPMMGAEGSMMFADRPGTQYQMGKEGERIVREQEERVAEGTLEEGDFRGPRRARPDQPKFGNYGDVSMYLFRSPQPGDPAELQTTYDPETGQEQNIHGHDAVFNSPEVKGVLGLSRDANMGAVKDEINKDMARWLQLPADEVSLAQISPSIWVGWAKMKGLSKTTLDKMYVAFDKATEKAQREGKEPPPVPRRLQTPFAKRQVSPLAGFTKGTNAQTPPTTQAAPGSRKSHPTGRQATGPVEQPAQPAAPPAQARPERTGAPAPAADTGAEIANEARQMVKSGFAKSVSLVGSQASGTAKPTSDYDILVDLGDMDLPADSGEAAEAIIEQIDQRGDGIRVGERDYFFRVGDRFFHLSSGAGTDLIENTDYALDQAGKPMKALAGRVRPMPTPKAAADTGELPTGELRQEREKRQELRKRSPFGKDREAANQAAQAATEREQARERKQSPAREQQAPPAPKSEAAPKPAAAPGKVSEKTLTEKGWTKNHSEDFSGPEGATLKRNPETGIWEYAGPSGRAKYESLRQAIIDIAGKPAPSPKVEKGEKAIKKPKPQPEKQAEAPKPEPEPAKATKEPWQMTREEFLGEGLPAYKGLSKVNWKTGEPIRFVDATQVGKRVAGYFSSDKAVAERFVRVLGLPGSMQLTEARIVFKRPYEVDARGRPASEFMTDALNPTNNHPELVQALESPVYDGLIIRNTSDEGTVYVPKMAQQIRADITHRTAIEQAVSEGKPVPAEVLADYPDLQKAAPPTPAPQASPAADTKQAVRDWLADNTSTRKDSRLISEVRAAVDGNPADVDAALFALSNEGVVGLIKDDAPAGIRTEAWKAARLQDELGNWYGSVAVRKPKQAATPQPTPKQAQLAEAAKRKAPERLMLFRGGPGKPTKANDRPAQGPSRTQVESALRSLGIPPEDRKRWMETEGTLPFTYQVPGSKGKQVQGTEKASGMTSDKTGAAYTTEGANRILKGAFAERYGQEATDAALTLAETERKDMDKANLLQDDTYKAMQQRRRVPPNQIEALRKRAKAAETDIEPFIQEYTDAMTAQAQDKDVQNWLREQIAETKQKLAKPDLSPALKMTLEKRLAGYEAEVAANETNAAETPAQAPAQKEAAAPVARAAEPPIVMAPTPSEKQAVTKASKEEPVKRTGLTKSQEQYLAGKLAEVGATLPSMPEGVQRTKPDDKYPVYPEELKALPPVTIEVPDDGTFTVRTWEQANNLHRRVTGKPLPNLPEKANFFQVAAAPQMQTPLPEMQPTPMSSRPMRAGMLDVRGEEGYYPFDLHKDTAWDGQRTTSSKYLTDGYSVMLRDQVDAKTARDLTGKKGTRVDAPETSIDRGWGDMSRRKRKDARIVGVAQLGGRETPLVVLEASGSYLTLDAGRLRLVMDATKANGLRIDKDSAEILKDGKPVGYIMAMREDAATAKAMAQEIEATGEAAPPKPTRAKQPKAVTEAEPDFIKEARERIRSSLKGETANSGQQMFDSLLLFGYDAYEIGVDFATWSQRVIKRVGREIAIEIRKMLDTYLPQIWDMIQPYVRQSEQSTPRPRRVMGGEEGSLDAQARLRIEAHLEDGFSLPRLLPAPQQQALQRVVAEMASTGQLTSEDLSVLQVNASGASVTEKTLPPLRYATARKGIGGKWRLLYKGTHLEVFPKKTWPSAQAARGYLQEQINKRATQEEAESRKNNDDAKVASIIESIASGDTDKIPVLTPAQQRKLKTAVRKRHREQPLPHRAVKIFAAMLGVTKKLEQARRSATKATLKSNDANRVESLINEALANPYSPLPTIHLAEGQQLRQQLRAKLVKGDVTVEQARSLANRFQFSGQQRGALLKYTDALVGDNAPAMATIPATLLRPQIVQAAERRLELHYAGAYAGSGAQAIVDQAIVTGYKLYKAGMSFDEWSRSMLKEMGQTVRPHLKATWDRLLTAVRQFIADEEGSLDISQLSWGALKRKWNAAAQDSPTRTTLQQALDARVAQPFQMTASEFQEQFYQHGDLRAKTETEQASTLGKVQREGFQSRHVNALRPTGRKWTNVVERNYATRAGQMYYLVPNEWIANTPNGPKVKEGWKPTDDQAVRVRYDGQPVHEALVERAIQQGRDVPARVLADYPEMRPASQSIKQGIQRFIAEEEGSFPASPGPGRNLVTPEEVLGTGKAPTKGLGGIRMEGLGNVEEAPRKQPKQRVVIDPLTGARTVEKSAPRRQRRQPKPLTAGGRFQSNLVSVSGIPRALMASADLSAPLRQGAILSLPPTQWRRAARASLDMIQSLSPTQHEQFRAELHSDIDADIAKDMGLYLATDELGSNIITGREEDFISKWAGKIPVVGTVVRASERAYTTYLDSLRLSTFKSYMQTIEKAGGTPAQREKAMRAAARWINSATGRGTLGKNFDEAAPLLSTIFFAPRYVASRLQVMNPAEYAAMPGPVRARAMGELFQYGAVIAATLALAQAAGATVALNPDEPDFLKIKFGNTRYDVLAGTQQVMRLFWGMGRDAVRAARGEEAVRGRTAMDIGGRFLRSKLAPVPSFFTDMMLRRDYPGRPFEASKGVRDRVMPLMWKDAYQAYQTEGVGGIAKQTPGFFGIGVQTYEPRRSTQQASLTRPTLNRPAPVRPRRATESR